MTINGSGAKLQTSAATLRRSHRSGDVQRAAAAAQIVGRDHDTLEIQSGSVATTLLRLTAAAVDDTEAVRIATENRIRAMRNDHGLDGTPQLGRAEAILDLLKEAERLAVKELEAAMRHHPLREWVERTPGVGTKQAARLLAAIGDPYLKPPIVSEDGELVEPARPRRGPAELWQYCGHGDPARSRRRRGERVEFSPEAKMRVHLIAKSCLKHKARSPYGRVYDEARAAWQLRDTTDAHRHNHALRIVGKAVLKDLWLEARAVSGQRGRETHASLAADRETEEATV